MAERDEDVRRMAIEEFPAGDNGTATRFELERGVPVAMSPPLTPHVRIGANPTVELERPMADRRPCRVMPGAGAVVDRALGSWIARLDDLSRA